LIKAIVFDLDGVLISSKKSAIYALRKSINSFGYNYTKTDINQRLEKKPLDIMKALMKKDRKNDIEKCKKIFDKIGSSKKSLDMMNAYPKIRYILKNLRKKYNLFIATNSDRKIVEKQLKTFNIKKYWKKIICADDRFKNKQEIIKHIMKKHKLSPREVIYIGDRKIDIDVAKDVGCISVIIENKFSWGKKEKIKKGNPDFIIHKLEDLQKIAESC